MHTDLSLSLSADHEPAEVTGCRQSCQEQARSRRAGREAAKRPAASAEERVCHRPVLQVSFRQRDGAINRPGNVWPPAHVDQYLLQWKRDRVQPDHCVCVCVCVSSRVSVRRWDHNMTQHVHMLKTWRLMIFCFPRNSRKQTWSLTFDRRSCRFFNSREMKHKLFIQLCVTRVDARQFKQHKHSYTNSDQDVF